MRALDELWTSPPVWLRVLAVLAAGVVIYAASRVGIATTLVALALSVLLFGGVALPGPWRDDVPQAVFALIVPALVFLALAMLFASPLWLCLLAAAVALVAVLLLNRRATVRRTPPRQAPR